MKSRKSEVAVGLFVLITVTALFFLAFMVSGIAGNFFNKSYHMTANFENVSGLKERAKVTLGGVTVGYVDDIGLSVDPKKNLSSKVTISLDEKLTTYNAKQRQVVLNEAIEELKIDPDFMAADKATRNKQISDLKKSIENGTVIDADAYIKVATNGLIGEKYLKIVPGGSTQYLQKDGQFSEFNTQGTIEIEDLVDKFIGNTASKANSESAESDPVVVAETTSTEPAQTDDSFGGF